MPIYDLECPRCRASQKDVLMSVKADEGSMECPVCHKFGLIKKPCRVHARFFGDGWTTSHRKGD